MPFEMNHSLLLSALTFFLVSCNWDAPKSSEEVSRTKVRDIVKMLYYNPHFKLDTTSKLRLDGYYQIRQVFGSYATNDKGYYQQANVWLYTIFQ